MKSCLALRHVHFEDLGAFAPALRSAGYDMAYLDAGIDDIGAADAGRCDLLVVLGGPIAAYEEDVYPFLRDELRLIERRLALGRPLMGICLGAQLIARALGARVYPSGGKEIGFAPIRLNEAGLSSCLAPFADDPMTLHWHGDTFDLPQGATLLASTNQCRNQAFTMGPHVIGLQFHPEAGGPGFERWLIGHACQLSASGIAPADLRRDAEQHGPALAAKAQSVMARWLGCLQGMAA
jgi:GMP synthase (glutamine-hydrolysing)